MKRLQISGVLLTAVIAVGVSTTTTTFALPDVSLTLSGSAFPLHLVVTLLTAKIDFSSGNGPFLTGEGLLLLLLTAELSSLGTFEALFTNVTSEGQPCHSEEGGAGGPAEEVLTKGTYHIVYTSLSPLTPGVLYLYSEFTLDCGARRAKVRGNVLSSLNAGAGESSELTDLGGVLTGNGGGVPKLKTYYNDSGTAATAKVEQNFGMGWVLFAEEIAGEVAVTASKGNMFVITGR